MLHGIKQNDSRLLRVIQKYGCLFLCFAQASPMIFSGDEGIKALNSLWLKAEKEGAITPDLNADGDYDDAGEAEVKNHDKLASIFALDVHYDGIHHDAEEEIPENVSIIFGQFFYKSGHFVNLNRRKEVTHDPLGYSNTVKNGTLKTMRWYYAN